MENAVKALYISAGVLIGVMILSLGVVLYSNLQGYVENANEQTKFNEQAQFNARYTKYINVNDSSVDPQFELTIQDIVSVAGDAYENNYSYNPNTSEWNEENNSLYIAIYLDGYGRIDKSIKENMVDLLRDNTSKRYKCQSEDVLYGNNTGKIYKMTFSEI